MDWSIPEVFSTALRFVRVDRGCKITDKDEHAAFLVFECPTEPNKPPSHGGFEVFRAEGGDGRPTVRVQVALSDEPRYMEKRFLDLLLHKLRDERGTPPPRPNPPAPPATDGGA